MASSSSIGVLLEAEVAPRWQSRFEKRYHAATGVSVTPGTPPHYQSQGNKWSSELRVYFNDLAMATSLSALGLNVEKARSGYRSGQYRFRVNDNRFWWKLVESSSLRLGLN